MPYINRYTFLFLKFIFYIFAGTILFISVNFIFQIYYDYPEEYNILQHIGTIFLTAFITEGIVLINPEFKKKKRLSSGILKKISVNLVFVISVVSVFSIMIMLLFASDDRVIITWFDLIVINLISIIYSLSVILVLSLYRANKNLKDSQVKMESFKKEKAEAKFHAMKMQLSPHFLFNTLNTLYGIIDKKPGLAKDYLLKISDIYRYVLENENNELVELRKELDFARDYAFLISKRYEDAFEFHMKVPETLLSRYIPPLTMQILVENALKHNKMDKNHKLKISVYSQNDKELMIRNNKRLKPSQGENTGIGLRNLNSRYKYLDNREISIINSKTEFIVCIPIIKLENYYAGTNC